MQAYIYTAVPTDMDETTRCVEGSNLTHIAIRSNGITILVIFAYFKDGIGMTGPNIALIERIAGIKSTAEESTIVLADFNMSPEALHESGYTELVNMDIVSSAFQEGTCRTAKHAVSLP